MNRKSRFILDIFPSPVKIVVYYVITPGGSINEDEIVSGIKSLIEYAVAKVAAVR